jgi:hypothetical protein
LQVLTFLVTQRDDVLLDRALLRRHRIDPPASGAAIDSEPPVTVNDGSH